MLRVVSPILIPTCIERYSQRHFESSKITENEKDLFLYYLIYYFLSSMNTNSTMLSPVHHL